MRRGAIAASLAVFVFFGGLSRTLCAAAYYVFSPTMYSEYPATGRNGCTGGAMGPGGPLVNYPLEMRLYTLGGALQDRCVANTKRNGLIGGSFNPNPSWTTGLNRVEMWDGGLRQLVFQTGTQVNYVVITIQ